MRNTCVAVGLTGIFLVILLSPGLSAQTPSAPRWEYGILEKVSARFRTGEKVYESGSGGYVGLHAALGGAKAMKKADRAEDAVFQLLGQGGWEIVAADADRVYFKRLLG